MTRLLTVPEAAQALGIGRAKAWELVMSGALESITIGRARRVPDGALERFVADRLEGRDVAARVVRP